MGQRLFARSLIDELAGQMHAHVGKLRTDAKAA